MCFPIDAIIITMSMGIVINDQTWDKTMIQS
jgi:hypothetical protein